MNAKVSKNGQEQSLESAKFVMILGLITEMARRVNENIAKVQLPPMPEVLPATGSSEANHRGEDK